MNSEGKLISARDQVQSSCTMSVILSTHNHGMPEYIDAQHVRNLIPKHVSNQIIVVHYKQHDPEEFGREADESVLVNNNINNKNSNFAQSSRKNEVINAWVSDEFTYAIMKGVKLSNGQFILVVDGDVPYPDDAISRLIQELLDSPNSIIIASKYGKGYSTQRLPLIRTAISKCARFVVRHGLSIRHVQDPLSGCFAISSGLLKDIIIEGKGDELLLEILVKLNRSRKHGRVPVKEIPYGQKGKLVTKKLDLSRISSYTKAVWHLYRYGQKSQGLTSEFEIVEHDKHKSVLFLSKAGRFFTVGASGLVVNYVVSFLLSNLIPNIWYIHATLFGIIVSISTNFVLNKVWTFEDWDFSIKHFLRQYGLFLLLCSFGAGIQLFLVSVFVDYYHIQYSVSLIMAVCIASIGNFLLNKKITFGEKIWE